MEEEAVRGKLSGIFLILGTGAVAVSVVFFVSNEEKRREVEGTYEALRETYYREESPHKLPEREICREEGSVEGEENSPAGGESPWLPEEKSSPEEAAADRVVDWEGLQAWSPRITGWLEIPGTALSYPVVQGEDNTFYLHHSIDGEESEYGAIFLGAEHREDFSDSCSFIYGHNMLDGEMFALLNQYESPEFAVEHPVFCLDTPYGERVYQIFSVEQARVGGRSFGYEYSLGGEDYQEQLLYLKEASLYPIDAVLDRDASMVTLVTCNRRLEEEVRLAVHGILVSSQ